MSLWKYEGPVYVDGKIRSDKEILYTHAKTREQASNNFFYQGKQFDVLYPYISHVEYEEDELAEMENEYRELVNGESTRKCPHCGGNLSDGGMCYNCSSDDF
jgi:hypothetical protein